MWTLRICSTKNDDQTAISTRIFFQLKLNSKVSWNKKMGKRINEHII
jgi:hypothetical protein